MRSTIYSGMAVTVFALAACAPAAPPADSDQEPAVNTALEAEAIMQLDQEWIQRYADRDIEWITNLHTADAVQLPPGSDIIEGNTAIGAAWQGMVEVFPEVNWEAIATKVSQSGDMAYVYGTATATTADGNDIPMKFIEIWVKIDGEWKVAADMFNANVQ